MDDAVALTRFGALSLLLVAAAVCDLRTGRVFNRLTYTAMVLGFAGALVIGAISETTSMMTEAQHSVLAWAAGMIGFAIIFAAGGLGGGDVKTMGAVGAISASWQCVLATAFYGFIAGALIAVFVMIRKRLVKRTASRIYRALLLAGTRQSVAMPAGKDSEHVPFALALCVGGILAGLETLMDVRLPWSPIWQ